MTTRSFCEIVGEYLSREKDIQLVGTANDGFEALELIKQYKPDILVLDIIMPHWTDWEFWKSLMLWN